ncbi:MAG: VIT domain-containing protein [Chloroflexota bacterium]
MKKIPLLAIILIALLAAVFGPAAAQEQPPIISTVPPVPPIWNFGELVIEYQRVNVTIANQVATTHVDQLFVNTGDGLLEGTYLFPLPPGAAVSQLTMWVDGRAIEAKILPAGEARAIYDEIVRQLRDPALLEYVGSSAIQANVFPIPAHAERRVELEYSQVLTADNGLFHYVYPQSTDLYTNTPLQSQSIHVEVQSNEAIRALYSPSHTVSVERDGEFRAVVGYEASHVQADADFELFYTVSPEEIGLSLLSYKEAGEDGFFILLAAPSVNVNPDEVVARDVILVLDTSGSMEGEKMAQAKEAALYVLDHLNPQDRYNIVAFSTGVRLFSDRLTPQTADVDYRSFINSLAAVGSTNIGLALLEAAGQADNERPLTILFLTDGLATEGITDTALLLDNVREAMPEKARLFAFGVGYDVDTFLLDSLAENHQGTTTYVRPGEAIDEAVSSFYAKVSTPVLSNISLDFGEIVAEQLYPADLPDLFAGSQLALAGRYRQGGPTTITLSGEVNGRQQVFTYEDMTFRTEGGEAFIPRLWATRAIGHLLNQIRLHGEDPELVQSVVNLSLRYGVITPYTSYLIQEEDIFSQSARDEMAVAPMALPTQVTGQEAVEAAYAFRSLAVAEAPLPVEVTRTAAADGSTVAQESVKLVDSKAFVYRDGVWMDTAYNPDEMTAQEIDFASDGYFDLLTAAPDLGQYLALGQRVLVVYQGQAYEIVLEGGDASPTLPQSANSGVTTSTEPIPTPEATGDGLTVAGRACPAAIFLPLLLLGAAWLTNRRRR